MIKPKTIIAAFVFLFVATFSFTTGTLHAEENKAEPAKQKAKEIEIPAGNVKFFTVNESKDGEKRTGLYAMGTVDKENLKPPKDLFSNLADGKIGPPKTSDDAIILIGKLSGEAGSYDTFISGAALIKNGKIDIPVKFIRYTGALFANARLNVYVMVTLPMLPAGKYQARITFKCYTRREPGKKEKESKEEFFKPLVCDFEVMQAKQEKDRKPREIIEDRVEKKPAPERKIPPQENEPVKDAPLVKAEKPAKEKHPWADYQEGTWVKMKATMPNMTIDMKYTVKSNDSVTLVYEMDIETFMNGKLISNTKNEQKINLLDIPRGATKIEDVYKKTGEEIIKNSLGEFKCEIWESKAGPDAGPKMWRCKAIPLMGMVKMENTKVQMKMELVDFQEVKVPIVPIIRVNPKDGHPWKLQKPGAWAQWQYKSESPSAKIVSGVRMTTKTNDGKEMVYKNERLDEVGDAALVVTEATETLAAEAPDPKDDVEWKKIGNEKIKVLAGEFDCEVWQGPYGKLWRSDEVPFGGIVKRVYKIGETKFELELIGHGIIKNF